ncbi:MAG TPA: hypothetical protein VF883_03025 [Thermoanaerobaculia bacterium]
MLPSDLRGPGLTIRFAPAAAERFVRENSARYLHLDPHFISQICFEHPDRFDALLPRFDPALHAALRIRKPAGWIIESTRWEDGSVVDFWCSRFERLFPIGDPADEVLSAMLQTGSWHFPPVIVESTLAASLGAPAEIGTPYLLVEGTHRVSYLRSMLRRGLSEPTRLLDVIEIVRAE